MEQEYSRSIIGALPSILAGNLTKPSSRGDCEARLSAIMNCWTEDEMRHAAECVSNVGDFPQFYRASPGCRRLARVWSSYVVTNVSTKGLENLEDAYSRGPTILVTNHASYIDSPLLDYVISRHNSALADKLVHLAGLKVFQSSFRRIAAICINTIPVEQSEKVKRSRDGAEGTSRLGLREVAQSIGRSIRAAHEATQLGHLLTFYPEGSRTRDGRLQPFLKPSYRYLNLSGAMVVPAAIEGTGAMMGIESDAVTPGPCRLTVGSPISVADCGGPRFALAEAEKALAALLPEHMKPRPDAQRVKSA